ncbi:MAG: hypothetical protein LVS60_11030 [Nodosilinea sp. LVE1205-7]
MVNQSKPLPISRRTLLKAGTRLMGVSTLSGWLGSFPLPLMVPGGNSAIAAELPARGTDLTPNQALQKLLDGNQRFVQRQRQNPHQDFSRLKRWLRTKSPLRQF